MDEYISLPLRLYTSTFALFGRFVRIIALLVAWILILLMAGVCDRRVAPSSLEPLLSLEEDVT